MIHRRRSPAVAHPDMKLQPFEQVLVDGGRRELLKFGGCERCVVVDWRDDVEADLAEVNRMLPGGYLQYRSVDGQTWELRCHDVSHSIVGCGADEQLLKAINRALLPEFEMRIFTPTMGDSYSLLLRPAAWWSEFSTTHPARARKLFVTTDERAKRVGTGDTPTVLSRWEQNWMNLLGWQRGILGTVIVVGSLFLILCIVALFVTLFR